MKSKTDEHYDDKNKPQHKDIGDAVVHGIEAPLISYLSKLCEWFQVTPESINNSRLRPNSPPPAGGVSSIPPK